MPATAIYFYLAKIASDFGFLVSCAILLEFFMVFSISSHDVLFLIVTMLGAGTVVYIISDIKKEDANSNENSIIGLEVGLNK